jgi:hypothetical protein
MALRASAPEDFAMVEIATREPVGITDGEETYRVGHEVIYLCTF